MYVHSNHNNTKCVLGAYHYLSVLHVPSKWMQVVSVMLRIVGFYSESLDPMLP